MREVRLGFVKIIFKLKRPQSSANFTCRGPSNAYTFYLNVVRQLARRCQTFYTLKSPFTER